MNSDPDWTASALFSPSKARIQQAQAKDWSFVDAWLVRRYGTKRLPTFERNEDTLQVLLSLATLNESADEQSLAIDRVEKAALQALSKASNGVTKDVETTLLSHLDQEGTAALQTLADASFELNATNSDVVSIAARAIDQTNEAFDSSEQLRRIERQCAALKQEQARLQLILTQLKDDAFQPPSDLLENTAEWQRRSKHMKAKVAEYDERLAALRASKPGGPSLDDINRQRLNNELVQGRLEEINAELTAYQDLPSDGRTARKVLDQARQDLRQLIEKRDHLFEEMANG